MSFRAALLLCVALLPLAACGGDDSTPAPAATVSAPVSATPSVSAPTPATTPDRHTPTPTPTPPPNLTSQQVCDLAPAASVAAALGVSSVEQKPVDVSTPQCSYTFTSGDSTNNLVLAVMRDSDVGGRTGSDAFEYAVSVNRAVAGDAAEETEVPDLGDQAVFMSGPAVKLLIVQAGLRIVTVAGTELNADAAAAIAQGAVKG